MEKIIAVWDSKASGTFENIFDCYLAEALLSEGHRIGTEEETLLKYKTTSLADLAEKQQKKFAEQPKLAKLFYEIEQPLSKVLWQMEQHGIVLDTKKLEAVGEKIDGAAFPDAEKIPFTVFRPHSRGFCHARRGAGFLWRARSRADGDRSRRSLLRHL